MLERHPGLQLLLAHGGGNAIFLKGRLDSAYHARGAEGHSYYRDNISKPPGDYFEQIFFDTCSLSAESVEFTVKVMGADHVMFGTDYPFEVGDGEGKRALRAIDWLPERDKRKILYGNAAAALAPVKATSENKGARR